ncbi:hypothetical protein DSO57_1035347 [Entomophthora muscae]|uniref:Uncharacterized protein n=1 Tax=Entomophthora muscae TaxID=34485 RepID=A0ACC2RQJ4_9FUNG|nr:hypothetical protein DSO57_1035347 [Entomophthora muscae]
MSSVKILYFGESQDHAGMQIQEVNLLDISTFKGQLEAPAAGVSLGALFRHLCKHNASLEKFLSERLKNLSFALNMSYIEMSCKCEGRLKEKHGNANVSEYFEHNFADVLIKAGDEIAVIPPVSGG